MKAVKLAHLFLAVAALVWGLSGGGFAADLSAEAIAEEQYAWLVSAEAQAEQALDRAFLTFDSSLIDGDVLTVASHWLRVFKLGGQWRSLAAGEDAPDWLARRAAFFVPSGEKGTLCLVLEDRAALGNAELELQIEYFDGTGNLVVALVDEREGVIALSADYGNLLEDTGEGEVVVKALEIPLRLYPETRGVYLRGEGEMFILGVALIVKESSELSGDEIADQPTAHPPRRDSVSSGIGEARPPWPAEVPMQDREGLAEPVVRGPGRVKPKAGLPAGAGLRAKRVSAQSISQFVQRLRSGVDFIMTRDVLSGGGARQRSGNFILESTFAQDSAIGFSFSSGGNLMLHAGYQQADDQRLAILNVGAIPPTFNPRRGEITTLSYVLSTRSPRVSIEVTDNTTTVVLMPGQTQGAGLHTVQWDGRDGNGNFVGLGDWTFVIRARNYQGQVVTANTLVTLKQRPVIRLVVDDPDPFCPATDLINAISYTTDAAQNLDVTLVIEDASANPVASFSANNQAPGSYVFNWDGTGATREGLYIYSINARRAQGGGPLADANGQTGTIILACGQECETSADDNVRVCHQPDGFDVVINAATPDQISGISRALFTGNVLFSSRIYDIEADPATTFDPPAIMIFRYDPAIDGDISGKLELRRYDEATAAWVAVANQFVDYANNRVIAEVTSLSLFALFAAKGPTRPDVLAASVRLEPEALQVNPGILTAWVSLREGFAESGIIAATCEGAAAESMALSADGTEMIVKFRRQAIEAALAEQGETLDTHFVVEGIWQGPEGSIPFAGEDDIARIISHKDTKTQRDDGVVE